MNTNPTLNRNLPAERQASLSRRRFLRGLGACMALPAFESLAPLKMLAAPALPASTGTAAPVRMAYVYIPNGTIPSAWWPEGDGGKDFTLSRTLQPLHNVRHEMQVISGLEDISANPGADGGGDHARAGGTFRRGEHSRAALDRLLDPGNGAVTLQTLTRAAHAVGRGLRIELV